MNLATDYAPQRPHSTISGKLWLYQYPPELLEPEPVIPWPAHLAPLVRDIHHETDAYLHEHATL